MQSQEQQETFGCQLLDVPALGSNPAPEQLMQQLSLFAPQQQPSQPESALQAELTAAAYFNLAHPALLSEADSQSVLPAAESLPASSAPAISTNDFVKTCFAAMGRKQ